MESKLNEKSHPADGSFPMRSLCDLVVFPRMVVDLFCRTGAKVVGFWFTDGYSFEKSSSVTDDKSVGLVIDHEN